MKQSTVFVLVVPISRFLQSAVLQKPSFIIAVQNRFKTAGKLKKKAFETNMTAL